MKETKTNRIKRLETRKGELLKQVNIVRGSNNIRNAGFKREMLNDRVQRITTKIAELRRNLG